MKGTSVHQIRIDEKKFIVNRSIPHYFGSASLSGFFGFLKFFSFIFLLENIKFITGINENFQFDIIDISISITGFIFNFLITIIYSYQKHEGRPKQVENKSEPPIEEVYEKKFLNGKSIAIEIKNERGQKQTFEGSDKAKFFKVLRPEGVPVTPPPAPKSKAQKLADRRAKKEVERLRKIEEKIQAKEWKKVKKFKVKDKSKRFIRKAVGF